MNKTILLSALLALPVSAAKVDFMVLQTPVTDELIEPTSIIQKNIEYINRMFSDNKLSIKREIGKISEIKVSNPIANLSLEMTSLVAASYGVTGLSHLDEVALSGKVGRDVAKWLKKDSENYKVLMVPFMSDSLSCGITYVEGDTKFSILYMTNSGVCSSPWVFAHELGHQDGLQHEDGESGEYLAGKCIDGQSIMYSGLQGGRSGIYGNPELCPSKKEETPYSHYKAISDKNKRKGFVPYKSAKIAEEPIILTEIYNGQSSSITAKLTVYNPNNKHYKGKVTFVNEQAPVSLSRRSFKVKTPIRVKPRAVGNYEFQIPIGELSLIGSKLKVLSRIEWE